jgi:hypothetical protein
LLYCWQPHEYWLILPTVQILPILGASQVLAAVGKNFSRSAKRGVPYHRLLSSGSVKQHLKTAAPRATPHQMDGPSNPTLRKKKQKARRMGARTSQGGGHATLERNEAALKFTIASL